MSNEHKKHEFDLEKRLVKNNPFDRPPTELFLSFSFSIMTKGMYIIICVTKFLENKDSDSRFSY
jgi:hypothetical protein